MLRESDAHYLYTVAGREYRSTQLTFKSIPYIPPWALYDRPYRGPNGVPIVVFYDPQKPSRAVLLPGPDVLNFAGTAILGLFTVAAIWLEWLILVSDR